MHTEKLIISQIQDYATAKLRHIRDELDELQELVPPGRARKNICAAHAFTVAAINRYHWRPEETRKIDYQEDRP